MTIWLVSWQIIRNLEVAASCFQCFTDQQKHVRLRVHWLQGSSARLRNWSGYSSLFTAAGDWTPDLWIRLTATCSVLFFSFTRAVRLSHWPTVRHLIYRTPKEIYWIHRKSVLTILSHPLPRYKPGMRMCPTATRERELRLDGEQDEPRQREANHRQHGQRPD